MLQQVVPSADAVQMLLLHEGLTQPAQVLPKVGAVRLPQWVASHFVCSCQSAHDHF